MRRYLELICSKGCPFIWHRADVRSGIFHKKISGGNLRFQAQHLRKIRLPAWDDIDSCIQTELIRIGRSEDTEEAKVLVARIYSMNEKENKYLEYK